MGQQFAAWLGVGDDYALKQLEEREQRMRDQYQHPIDQFPRKVDELLDALDRVRVLLLLVIHLHPLI